MTINKLNPQSREAEGPRSFVTTRMNATREAPLLIVACLVVVLISLGISIVTATVVSADEPPKAISLDGQGYTLGEVLADFLDVAFTDKVWRENRSKTAFARALRNVHDSVDNESIRTSTPWFVEYLTTPNGLPKSGVINKWDDDITIGIGMAPPADRMLLLGSYDGVNEVIQAHVQSLLKPLQQATGRPVALLAPGDRRDSGGTYARIRIVPTKEMSTPDGTFGGGPFLYERSLWSGVLLENSRNMMAYLLPRSDNRLGMVICKINPKTEGSLFKALITECLVRALGLPGLLQGESAVAASIGQPLVTVLGGWQDGLADSSTMGDDNADLSSAAVLQPISPFDLLMLSLLYCPAIKPGMTKNEVVQAVSSEFQCSTAIKGGR